MISAEPDSKLSAEELLIILEGENRRSVGYLSDEVSQDQDDNLDRYLGRPYGDEEDGSSQAMSMDVAEIVDWALPDILEPFLAGDRVAEFKPGQKGDEDYTEDATKLVEEAFFEDSDGVVVLHDVVKTALIQKIGVVKVHWQPEDRVEEHSLRNLSIINIQEFEAEDGLEIVEHTAEPLPSSGIDPEALPAFEDGMVHTAKVRKTFKEGKLKFHPLPPEEFKISQRAVSLDTASYLCHETEKTRADLIAMGFKSDLVMAAKSDGRREEDRSDTRFIDQDRDELSAESKMSDFVTLIEEYLRRGDEIIQSFRVGKQMLQDPEVVPWHPFEAWSPDRIPHRCIGLALADKVKQTQRIKTALTRQLLDNVYLANNPRFEVPDAGLNDHTLDDLLDYRVGGLIRTKGNGSMIKPVEVPDRSGVALGAITYMDSVREQQSGIVKNGMAISSEVIDPKSATESRRQDRNEQIRKRLMIRMFAETFIAPLWSKALKILVKYQDFERCIYINREWRQLDPRPWNSEMRAKVSAGLGHSNRDETLQGASLILDVQREALELGMATPANLYKTATKMIEAVGFRFPDQYFLDPESDDGKAHMQQLQESKQGDPREAELAGKLKLKQDEMQMDFQMESMKAERDIQLEMLKIEAKQAIEERKVDFDLKARMAQINSEYELAMEKFTAEMVLKRQQMAMEAMLKREEMAMVADQPRLSNGSASFSGVRFGGKVG